MNVDIKQLIQFRKTLHAFPEISGHEKETASRVLDLLKKCNPDEIITDFGGYGIIATWDSGLDGKEILLRSELDALPIQEINTFEHKSNYKGVSHKCGHDGHTSILCGIAEHLSKNKPTKGKVRLVFQPSEENGEGAAGMLADKRFDKFQPDFVFALHNLPGYPLHEVVIKESVFTASVSSIIIQLYGKTSHAAEPEHGMNPALAISQIIQESLALDYNKPENEDMRVVTPVFIEMGEKAYGISAGSGSIHLTLRCWNDANLRQLEKNIEVLADRISQEQKLLVKYEYTQIFHANINHPLALDSVIRSTEKKGLTLSRRDYPFKWGEDFGLFTSRFKGCMFGLGAGEHVPALHNPDYDFPDPLLETGIQIFTGIIDDIMENA